MDSGFLEVAFKMMVALGAVLLTFGLSVMAARKLSGFKNNKGKGKNALHALEILHSKSLGPGKSLITLKTAGKTLLLGVTNQNISFLSELASDQDEDMDGFSATLDGQSDNGIEKKLQSQLSGMFKGMNRV